MQTSVLNNINWNTKSVDNIKILQQKVQINVVHFSAENIAVAVFIFIYLFK